MNRWAWLLGLAALSGCERDPIFFGYWDLPRVERAGQVQRDVGFLEVLDDGSVAVFVRYGWAGNGFFPDPTPSIVRGETDQTTQDFVDGYREKGETYTIFLAPFATTFDVPIDRFRGDRAVLTSDAAAWPGQDPTDLQPTTLTLQR